MNKFYLLIFIFITSILSAYANESVIIGVAEKTKQKPYSAVVRALFKNSNQQWFALNSEKQYDEHVEQTMSWYIVFDGKKIGQLSTVNDIPFKYPNCEQCFARDKVISIKNENDFPKLGNKEKRFGNWGLLPENQPVTLNSQSYYQDKEGWKRGKPPSNFLKRFFSKLKTHIGDAYHCNGEPNWDATKIQLTVDDLQVYRAYINKAGEMIIAAGMATKHIQCDGPLDKTQEPIWFYINGDIKFIGYELNLLEAGDFDNDGDVEFIFSHSGYNQDGYSLFESKFSNRYDYYWHYH